MEMINGLIETRILLCKLCDGFSKQNSSKNHTLSIKNKVLFLLENKDQTPQELITELCIAKSNLANLLKSLMNEGLVESYKNSFNTRNINYHLTDKGRGELLDYKKQLKSEIASKINDNDFNELNNYLKSIIQILERI